MRRGGSRGRRSFFEVAMIRMAFDLICLLCLASVLCVVLLLLRQVLP